jgi:hypothetical protein
MAEFNPAPQKSFASTPLVNEYFTGVVTGANSTSGNFYQAITFMPLFIPEAMSLDQIGIRCDTSNASGSMRLGIYDSDSNNRPSTLVVDAGVVATTSTAALNITINVAVGRGWYWAAAVEQGSSAVRIRQTNSFLTIPVLSGPTQNDLSAPASAFIHATAVGGSTKASVTGALPSTVVVGLTNSGAHNVPLIQLRRSA